MFKTKKRTLTVILSLLLALTFAVTAHAAEPVQNADGYYELATVEDMLWFREQVAQGAVDMNAKLTEDIDLSGMSWQPIWYEDGVDDPINFQPHLSLDYGYNGTFDGNGKTLTLNIDNDSLIEVRGGGQFRAGLFHLSNEDAIVKNLTLTGTIDISGVVSSDRVQAAFVSPGWRGTVYNCQVKDATIQIANMSSYFVAGMVSILGANAEAIAANPTPKDSVIDNCIVDNVKIQLGANVGGGTIGLMTANVSGHATVQFSKVINGSSVQGAAAEGSLSASAFGALPSASYTGVVKYCEVRDMVIDIESGGNAYATGITGVVEYGSVIGCEISDSTLYAKGNIVYVGGVCSIAGTSNAFNAGEYTYIKDCVVENVDIKGTTTGRYEYIGGIAAMLRGNAGLQNNRVIDSSIYGVTEKTDTAGTRTAAVGGIVGRALGASVADGLCEIIDCVFQDSDVQWLASGDIIANTTLYIGGILGYTSTANAPVMLENCVALGDTLSADASQMTTRRIIMYAGGLTGQNNSAKVRNNTVAFDTFSLTNNAVATSAIYAGALSGQMIGTDAGANRAEHIGNRYGDDFFNSAYTWTAAPGTAGDYDPSDANKATYCYESDNEAYDQDGLLLDTLFVLLGGISDPLTMQFGQSITIDPLASLGEAQYNGITVEPIANGIISVTENIDGTVTITATGVGTTSVYVSYMTADGQKTEKFNVTVTATPEYAYVTAVITGTPTDGIYLDDTVNLTYDFDPYVAIPEIDNTGMTLSGLLAAIVDGKVVVTGVARVAGTYSYVVTLQGADGEIITQTVYVTIEGSSRPTGNGTYGSGSSNCSAGFGATALLSLLGLALVLRKK